jgi:hypothetical protein
MFLGEPEWWLRPVGRAERVVEHMAVLWKSVKRSPSSASRSTAGVRIGEP